MGAAHADVDLAAIGGDGGGAFAARCASGERLIGVALRKGDDVDAIRPLCAPADGDRDPNLAVRGDWHGGGGGTPTNIVCARHDPVVNGMLVTFEDADRSIVNDVALTCGPDTGRVAAAGDLDDAQARARGLQHCPSGQVAVGVHGRSGRLLDAVGLSCAVPTQRVGSIGKVDAGAPSTPHPAGWTICDRARDARARRSPAAANLEAQCRALPPPVAAPIRAPLESRAAQIRPVATRMAADAPAASAASTALPAAMDASAPASRHAVRNALVAAIAQDLVARVQASAGDGHRIAAVTRNDPSAEQRNVDTPASGRYRATDISPISAAALPAHAIRVIVQYPIAGADSQVSGESQASPTSCSAFVVSVRPASSARQQAPVRIDMQPPMRSANGVPACEYVATDLPFDVPLRVRVRMADQRAAGSTTRPGDGAPRSPDGRQGDTLDGDRLVTLSASRPSDTLRFEMRDGGSP